MTTEHKPDPEFVEYLENQVKNAFLSAATVMQMERVFIDQREKYLHQMSKVQEDYEQVMHRIGHMEAMLTPARMANEMWEKTMMEVIGEDGIGSVADAIRNLQVRADNAIPKCDGNHGGAPCRDRECWNDEGVYPFNGAQAASETPVDHLTILKRLNEATRQYRHNTDDDSGFVFAYDRHEIDGLVADLVATNNAWQAAREHERGEARFNKNGRSLTIADGRDRILAEIESFTRPGHPYRIDPDQVVISSDVPLRNDGLPASGRRMPDDPGVAVYFNLDGEPYCLPCDAWDRVPDNMAAIAAHLNAIRGIERWGVGDLRAQFQGFTAIEHRPERKWYDVLGCSEGAGPEEVRAAYKVARKQAHPDHGGTDEQFHKVQQAYAEWQHVGVK